jgi:hypothetical protein
MATNANFIGHYQDTAAAGTTNIFTGPQGYVSTINGLTFNNQVANNITVSIIRVNPPTTVVAYAFTLAAGDVISDNNLYVLGPGDILQITTTAGTTNYMFSANITAGGPTQNIFR